MARNNPLALGRDLAIDLGTANTLIYAARSGHRAQRAVGRGDRHHRRPTRRRRPRGQADDGPHAGPIKTIRPLKDGVIADFEVCEKMLRFFIQKVHASRWSKPRMVICVPSGITGVEQRAVQDAAEYAGARKPVHIIEEPMAAAIGADMPVHEPSGNMIVDIGGGTTEVAVISLGGIVTAQSVRVAGDELDDAVMQYVKKEFSLAIGDRTAEEIKIHMGSAWPLDEELTADIRGRDLISGLPRTVRSPPSRCARLSPSRLGHRRRREDHARQDAARAGRRHHGAGHHGHWRRRIACRARSTSRTRDRHADQASPKTRCSAS